MHGDHAIAIIGMGCRFAGADGVEEFWANLRSGRDAMTRDPSRDADLDPDAAAGRRVHSWGVAPDRTAFDHRIAGFAAPPADHDPQHGLLYEALWAAAEDAGVRLPAIGEATALYAGVARTRHVERAAFEEVANLDATFAGPKFSYFHDLQRESVMLDNSCATGLVAVHLAASSLRLGACDYAFAGGVAVMDPAGWYDWTPTSIYARDGVCRPFDVASTGTVPGDGVGAVLLRRLADAERDGDPIHAVLRTSAVGNDGRSKNGFVIPGVPGKIRVIRQALAQAGLTGAGLGYVEAHGVGIPMNDQIEATALTEALGPDGQPLAVGSVKASIGHTDTAAGLAALIKATLTVRDGFLPATPNTSEPIEELTKGGSRYSIVPHGRPWAAPDGPRRAGVMSAGVGGTNAFAIVEEYGAA
ncbi:polyketide synthase [Dactylosporangium sp. AC04546]|uniref:beta-ketoacyl [acyl carrier protein] synthase domain-containing protein n=1 Tax=Dactylosporangium sp. AC04546 TaxID=2862460 RepID=UPI001EDD7A45|nr:polyketide synthase [Dactylosporangium sp. AC04546]WVK88767.1 polyketide synthase [Dactylosporangium sp. AC04546]